MATVIDALVITLGLDPKGVKKGSAEAEVAMGKARSAAGKMGDGIDRGAQQGADAIRKLSREALSFFAVLTAGKTLKAFVADTTASNIALGNMARNIGTSAQSLGAWQNVAAAFGGTASDVSGSMQSLVSQFQTIDGRQNLGRVFGQLGVGLAGANGQIRDMNELLPDLARAAQRLGPQQFSALGSQAGFSQGFINMLEQGPGKIQSLYRALKAYAPTAEDVKKSGELQMAWVRLTAQSESFGRSIMTSLTPEVHELMDILSGLIDKNKDWIRQDIDGYAKRINKAIKEADWKAIGADIRAFRDYLVSIDWQRVEKGIQEFASGADTAAKAVGGWGEASKILFELWLGSKFLRIVSLVTGFAGGMQAIAGYFAHLGLSKLDPNDKTGSWIDKNIPGASRLDDWAARNLGIGRTYSGQALAAEGTPYTAGRLLNDTGATQDQYQIFARSVAAIEGARYDEMGGAGGKYAGRYQMSSNAISEAAKYLGENTPAQSRFLSDPQMQERYFEAYTDLNAKYLSMHSEAFRKSTAGQKLAILGYAHNQGAGGAESWLGTGRVGKDGFGTSGTAYSDRINANLAATHAAIAATATPQPNATASTSTQTAHITINAPSGNARDIASEVGQQLQALNFRGRQTNLATQ
ncbi:MAG: hypothetical protein ABF593_04640 [Acetobacter papayae]|uniref:hypothetical protein n=1 Tax=Acetobacter papayae TaxID=1076592 RepID=UPI0039E9EB24